ncbi:acetyltransferase [Enterobacter sp. PGRG2]|uniref:acetyltransferase n=1 Tax=Enterobacter sp. PGRG2 TaxID=3104013 RepID=UPI002ABE5604|nr:acetyltransferase [Enterobacter sp. PGRG2]WJD51124.1 acetyltransferase [Enterobacter sp. PGRG2]
MLPWWKRRPLQPANLSPLMISYLRLEPSATAPVEIAPTALIDESAGEVRIGQGTKICHAAVIQGPAVIGAHCLIGNYAFIRPGSVLSNNVRVGFATEIKNAVIEKNVAIGPQCFIADSAIGQDAYLGAQVRTSNHRLDGKTVSVDIAGERIDTGCEKLGAWIGRGARLGIQVIILPGRIIAPDTLLGPRILVEKNLPSGRYSLKQEIIHKEMTDEANCAGNNGNPDVRAVARGAHQPDRRL